MVDGPGIRYVVFLAGCTLRCKYCHNPDTWKRTNGKLTTVGEIIKEILKYQSYFKFTGGGVTISGGEPLNQPDFLVELLKACREHGLHTVVDTSGSATVEVAERVFKYTDLLLLDIKSYNPQVFKEVTGVELKYSLDLLNISQRLNVPVWVRFVLVPGLTDNINDIKDLAAFLKGFSNVEKTEVLPFHKEGEYKWKNAGMTYELADTQPPSTQQVQAIQKIFNEK